MRVVEERGLVRANDYPALHEWSVEKPAEFWDAMWEFGRIRGDRGARAVVDIGLHERSMSTDEAVAVYRDRIGMSPEAARAEVCKNSMFPGTAVMYWLGTDTLHTLRRERERVEGASFSLRSFHDRLLSFGSIPVPLIAKVFA